MHPQPSDLLPLGDFEPADVWQTHVNAIFYGTKGPGIHRHFQTYVSLDYRLAHALADNFLQWATSSKAPADGPLFVHEWGVGNGNLAARFLSRLKEVNEDGAVYPRIMYTLCDYSEEILKGVRANLDLQEHSGRFGTVLVNAEQIDGFPPGSVHAILSNEIWDDLATKVLLKNQGTLYEEYLQPLIDPSIPAGEFEIFVDAFQNKELETLAAAPPFLDQIFWERSFQRTDLGDWPFGDVIQKHLEGIADDIPTPINIGAFRTLERARPFLAESSNGYTGMDYGMLGEDDLNREGRPYFKLYGGQYTNMVNFPLLAEVGKAAGFTDVAWEPQHDFVSRNLEDPVISLVELVQNHPRAGELAPWDVDVLMLQTLHSLNSHYRSPYAQTMDYPTLPGTPKKQRKLIKELLKKLSPRGVPDTVAYITESEVAAAAKTLRKIGYREIDLQKAFRPPPAPIRFGKMTLK